MQPRAEPQLLAAGRGRGGAGRTERLVDAVRRARVVEEHLEAERLGAHRHRRAHETCTRTRHLIYGYLQLTQFTLHLHNVNLVLRPRLRLTLTNDSSNVRTCVSKCKLYSHQARRYTNRLVFAVAELICTVSTNPSRPACGSRSTH